MDPSAPPVPVKTTDETVDELIARVLRRAHRTMEARNEPDEARAVLHVAAAPRENRLPLARGREQP
jgi:hypothetical protein